MGKDAAPLTARNGLLLQGTGANYRDATTPCRARSGYSSGGGLGAPSYGRRGCGRAVREGSWIGIGPHIPPQALTAMGPLDRNYLALTDECTTAAAVRYNPLPYRGCGRVEDTPTILTTSWIVS